jgi:hypothetical protein
VVSNSARALRLYRNRFPDRVLPSADKFQRLVWNLRNYGSFKKPRKTACEIQDEDLELNVLLHVEENPNTINCSPSANILTNSSTYSQET